VTVTQEFTEQSDVQIVPVDADSRPSFITEVDGALVPGSPADLDATGIDSEVLGDLALKLASTVPSFTTEWACQQLHLPLSLLEDLFWNLKQAQYVEVRGQSGPLSYRYAITQRGMEQVRRLLDVSGYIGAAPVSLTDYTAMIEWQVANRQKVNLNNVTDALKPLVLPQHSVDIAALASTSGRSLFLFGPSGNGKTSMGRLLHETVQGEMWIPYCINVDSQIIRIYDPQCHELVGEPADMPPTIDRRWVKIRRPLIISGGEMTLEDLDLTYVPSVRYYEAPAHLKANGGTFMIDDFGRQHVDPQDLLNRWIVPLEHQRDHLTLHTGQRILVPFRLMLIVATNLKVSDVADPAFLRRMGYRLHLDRPSVENYVRIFERYAAELDVAVPEGLIKKLLARYEAEGRELRASEPRDLIERARDICLLHDQPLELTDDVMETAWLGYFGNH